MDSQRVSLETPTATQKTTAILWSRQTATGTVGGLRPHGQEFGPDQMGSINDHLISGLRNFERVIPPTWTGILGKEDRLRNSLVRALVNVTPRRMPSKQLAYKIFKIYYLKINSYLLVI